MSQAAGIKISFPRFVRPMFVLLDSQLNRFNRGTTPVSNGGVFLKTVSLLQNVNVNSQYIQSISLKRCSINTFLKNYKKNISFQIPVACCIVGVAWFMALSLNNKIKLQKIDILFKIIVNSFPFCCCRPFIAIRFITNSKPNLFQTY